MNKLYVVGIGPGNYEQMTSQAIQTLKSCDIIIGYTVYVNLIREHFLDKEFLTTSMTKEVERCDLAFQKAAQGFKTAMVCSGDAGVYGMSGLLLELGQKYPKIEVEIVSGVTAAISGAGVLGAPLTHDFAVISLSDLLTPLQKIEKRLEGAAMADFVICLYNPSSKKRHDYLKRACDIILKYASKDTICGFVQNIGREGEKSVILTLEEIRNSKVDMFTTVFIGNSQTKNIKGKMVTPRGYQNV